MIELIETKDENQLEFHLSGQVTQLDYETVLTPAIEAALQKYDKIRVLAVVDAGFTGYDMGAVWADGKLGLSHWRGFERMAVVADEGWIATLVRSFALFMPCPVQVFARSEAGTARRWLRESLGTVHIIDLGGPSLQVQLMGRPDADDFDEANGDLDARLQERNGFRLLLDLREFEDWQGLSAIAGHFALVRDHAGLAQRVAVVGDNAWQKLGERITALFSNAQTQYFEASDFEKAKTWLTAD